MEYHTNDFWRSLLNLRMFKYTQIIPEFLMDKTEHGLGQLKSYSLLEVEVAR